ncbi:unnamed protein product [Blepharisma stoltei]|uniref:RING-type domain-containing protein n=1 Tax=Blepharisma stoltei TaxID=1481888 RepID=A0AAU9J7J0_9CILI|nr:unnamed protein product [Blepharisma stoltei]
MESLLECIICKEPYNQSNRAPIILTCGHTFCKSCVHKMSQHSQYIRCPIDRKFESRDLSSLNMNYAIVQIQEYERTGILAKERCKAHEFPIVITCKTCNIDCCPKCIRKHLSHDMYDMEHPTLIQELDNSMNGFEIKIKEYLDASFSAKNRLDKEISELDHQKVKLKKEIEDAFESLMRILENKKIQSIQQLDHKIKEKEDFLKQRLNDVNEQIKYYSMHYDEFQHMKKYYKESTFIDRVVSCRNVLRELNFVQFIKPKDINDNKLRIIVDTTPLIAHSIGSVSFNEKSSSEILMEQLNFQIEELKSNKLIYNKTNPEQKLSLEIQSISNFLCMSENIPELAKMHLIECCCNEILGYSSLKLSDHLKQELSKKIDTESLFDTKIQEYIPTLRSKLKYVKGLIYSLEKIHEKEWEKGLYVLHCLIINENEYDFAELYLQIALLRICSQSFYIINQFKVIDALPLVDLIKRYTKFHFLPSTMCYKQVMSSLRFAYKFVENQMPDFFFPYFKTQYSAYLTEMSSKATENIPSEYPSELLAIFQGLDSSDLHFWKDSDLSKQFLNKVHRFKEECSPWFQALRFVQERGEELSDFELAALERSLN